MAHDLPASPNQESSVPGAGTALALLLAINLFNYIDRQVLAAVEPSIRRDMFPDSDSSPEKAAEAKTKTGLLATAFLLSYMIMSPLFGYLADRRSRWALIAIGVAVWSLASGGSGLSKTVVLAGGGLATGFTVLMISRILVGVGEAAYGPAAPSIISDLYPVKKRGQVLSWFYVAIPVGSALGYTLGGQIESATNDWRWAFYIVVPPGLILAIWCLMMREPRRGGVDAAKEAKPPRLSWREYRVLVRTPSFLLCTIGMTAMTFALGGIAFWIPAFLEHENVPNIFGGVNAKTFFGALTALGGLIATLAGGYLGDKLKSRFSGSYFLVSGIAMLIAVPFVALIPYIPFPSAWIVLFLAVFCLFFNTGPTNTILANVTHPAIRSSAFALNIFVIHLFGDAISPPLLGWVIGHDRYPVAFGLVAVMVGIGGIFWLMGMKYLHRDTEAAPIRAPGEV